MRDLSDQQRLVYEFIRERIIQHHMPPTIREICVGCGIRHTNHAKNVVAVIERKGYLITSGMKARGITLTSKELAQEEERLAQTLWGMIPMGAGLS